MSVKKQTDSGEEGEGGGKNYKGRKKRRREGEIYKVSGKEGRKVQRNMEEGDVIKEGKDHKLRKG